MWLLVGVTVTSLMQPYWRVIQVEAEKHRIDPLLVAAVIWHESRFQNTACYRGSHGLMQIQLRPHSCKKSMAEARRKGLYNPVRNIRRGVELMAWWRGWWRKHHRHEGFHWLLFYNQGFGRCPGKKIRCRRSDRRPVLTGRRGWYAAKVLKTYLMLKGSFDSGGA